MKNRFLRMIAAVLILACVLPLGSVSAASGMTLYVDDARAESAQLCVGDTVEFECWFQSWASSMRNYGANHFVAKITTRDYSGGYAYIKYSTSGLSRGTLTGTIKGQKPGQVAVTVTVTAGYSCSPSCETYPVNVYDKISTVFYVNIDDVCEPDDPVDPDELKMPEFSIGVEENGKWNSVDSEAVILESGESVRFVILSAGWDEWDANLDGQKVNGRVFRDGNGGGFYYYSNEVKWSFDGEGDVILDSDDEYVTVKNRSKTTCALGELVAEVTLRHCVKSGTCYRSDSFKTKKTATAELKSEGVRVKIENPLEDIEVDKVPNPFTDVKKSDWYYDAFMKVYAAGWLHGVDISPEQDGSQIIYMEKNALKHGESKVSMQILTAEEWMKKAGVKKTAFEGGVQLFKLGDLGGAQLSLLAQNDPLVSVAANVGYPANRSYAVTCIYNTSGQAASYNTSPFTDVPLDRPFAQPVLWAANTGVVNGYGGGIFGPYRSITREQMCAIFVRMASNLGVTLPKNSDANFTDGGKIQGYAREAVAICQGSGIVKGDPGGTFRPQDNITAGELTQMIVNFRVALAG